MQIVVLLVLIALTVAAATTVHLSFSESSRNKGIDPADTGAFQCGLDDIDLSPLQSSAPVWYVDSPVDNDKFVFRLCGTVVAPSCNGNAMLCQITPTDGNVTLSYPSNMVFSYVNASNKALGISIYTSNGQPSHGCGQRVVTVIALCSTNGTTTLTRVYGLPACFYRFIFYTPYACAKPLQISSSSSAVSSVSSVLSSSSSSSSMTALRCGLDDIDLSPLQSSAPVWYVDSPVDNDKFVFRLCGTVVAPSCNGNAMLCQITPTDGNVTLSYPSNMVFSYVNASNKALGISIYTSNGQPSHGCGQRVVTVIALCSTNGTTTLTRVYGLPACFYRFIFYTPYACAKPLQISSSSSAVSSVSSVLSSSSSSSSMTALRCGLDDIDLSPLQSSAPVWYVDSPVDNDKFVFRLCGTVVAPSCNGNAMLCQITPTDGNVTLSYPSNMVFSYVNASNKALGISIYTSNGQPSHGCGQRVVTVIALCSTNGTTTLTRVYGLPACFYRFIFYTPYACAKPLQISSSSSAVSSVSSVLSSSSSSSSMTALRCGLDDIDLSPLQSSAPVWYVDSPVDNDKFVFRLCGTVVAPSCNGNAMLCQITPTDGNVTLSYPSNMVFSYVNASNKALGISIYTSNGQPSHGCGQRVVTVIALCSTNGTTTLTRVYGLPACFYRFIFYTPYACAKPLQISSSSSAVSSVSSVLSSSSSSSAIPVTCATSSSVGGYDLSSLSFSDLPGLSLSKQYQYFLRLCDTVSNSFCSSFAPDSGLCQVTVPPIAGAVIAAANSGSPQVPMSWSYIRDNATAGVIGLIQNGAPCGALSLPSLFVLQLVCQHNPSQLYFLVDDSEALPTSPVCLYLATLYTPLSCPANSIAADDVHDIGIYWSDQPKLKDAILNATQINKMHA